MIFSIIFAIFAGIGTVVLLRVMVGGPVAVELVNPPIVVLESERKLLTDQNKLINDTLSRFNSIETNLYTQIVTTRYNFDQHLETLRVQMEIIRNSCNECCRNAHQAVQNSHDRLLRLFNQDYNERNWQINELNKAFDKVNVSVRYVGSLSSIDQKFLSVPNFYFNGTDIIKIPRTSPAPSYPPTPPISMSSPKNVTEP